MTENQTFFSRIYAAIRYFCQLNENEINHLSADVHLNCINVQIKLMTFDHLLKLGSFNSQNLVPVTLGLLSFKDSTTSVSGAKFIY